MRSDRGAAAAELALLTPVLVLMLATAVFGGRLWLARASVADAAAAAARAASLARGPEAARADALRFGGDSLISSGLRCAPASIRPELGGFAVAPGRPARVDATVTCTVSMSDLTVPGVPGRFTVSATASSVLDRYRGRR